MLLVHLFNVLSVPFNWLNASTGWSPLAFGLQLMGTLFVLFLLWFLGRLLRI